MAAIITEQGSKRHLVSYMYAILAAMSGDEEQRKECLRRSVDLEFTEHSKSDQCVGIIQLVTSNE
jgi:hypothetical protein